MKHMKLLRLSSSVLAGIVLSLAFASAAHAVTYTVNSIDDGGNTGGAGVCDDGSGDCTLRAAIEAVNTDGVPGVINFNIPGAGTHTLTPQNPYSISQQVTINGETQGNPSYPTVDPGGAQCGTLVPTSLPATNTPHTLLIEIDGTNAINAYGGGVMQLSNATASGSTIKGLVMNRATSNSGFAIQWGVTNIDNITIECNYIGTNIAGTASSPNANGIGSFDNGYNLAGLTIQNNLVSGNSEANIAISSSGSTNSMIIQNNLIGTTASGEGAIGGTSNPSMTLNQVNTAQVSHNIISGNSGEGLRISNSQNLIFQGNYVGLNILGDPISNGGDGVVFYGTIDTTIGGTNIANRNIISANTGEGIHIYRDCSAQNGSYNSTTFNNYIGTTTNGTVQTGYGNGGAGIEVNEYYGGCVSVYKHQIGGDSVGQANIIAGNTNQGILIHQGGNQDVFSISTIGNSIYSNGQFGIDLARDVENDNGVADTDLGPNPLNDYLMSYPTAGYANYYLNKPTINSTIFAGNQLTINYNYQAPGVQDNLPSISSEDVVGYRIDVYLNDGTQDGAYAGYAQGKTHLGSFIINGSESNASHTFTSSAPLTSSMSVSASATVLWTTTPSGGRDGTAPPYSNPK